MLRASCGGAPGDSAEIDEQYRIRSPLTWLHRAVGLPLEMAAGIHDGHTGSVPVRQTLDAFNAVARAGGYEAIGEDEIEQLSQPDGRLASPKPSDLEPDAPYGREIHLRRHAGPARVTIFEGGARGARRAGDRLVGTTRPRRLTFLFRDTHPIMEARSQPISEPGE